MGIKTLIFVQNRDYCQSVAEDAVRYMRNPTSVAPTLTADESVWRAAAIEDLGSEEHLLGPVGGIAAPHHALLLPAERLLNESLFSRAGGVDILVATPTLAQGMNLPAEAVIIAGDGRFDRATQRSEQLYAHELLNAAGRAGRAGHYASGVVLVIPNELVAYDVEANKVGRGWFTLQQNVFSKSDQCLEIEDPIEGLLDAIYKGLQEDPVTNLLDRIQNAADTEARLIRYFLTRLPEEPHQEQGAATHTLNRSLAAFHARRSGNEGDFSGKLQVAFQARMHAIAIPELEPWIDQLARTTGLPVGRIEEMKKGLDLQPIYSGATTRDCLGWLFHWFGEEPRRFGDLIDPRSIGEVLRKPEFDFYMNSGAPSLPLLDRIQRWIVEWMIGATLQDLENSFGLGPARGGRCKRARLFIRGVVRELSYAAGLIAQVERQRLGPQSSLTPLPLSLGTLSACIKEGFDHPEKLAVRYSLGNRASRVACHATHAVIRASIETGSAEEAFAVTLRRVREALKIAG